LTVALALMVWGASSASAGGPTSVLVTSPSAEKAEALYYSDERYGELGQLLGLADRGSVDEPPEAELARAYQINVTWLAHDTSPWRMDRVFPVESEPQVVWIHTAAQIPETQNGYWHRAERPEQLRALLKNLGMKGRASGEGYTGVFPGPWQSQTPAAAAPEAQSDTATLRTARSASEDDTEWWWALPGAAAGAVLALTLRPLAARRPWERLRRETEAREPGLRQELRDV
jgi:hypothetical protein